MASYTILYIDDEPDLLELGKTFLEAIGDFAVDTRGSGSEGLAALRARSYDVIISDYLMPGMDGLAFLKAVRSEFGNLPFILFTGRGREDVVIEAINNGVDFYLQKGGDAKAQFAELAHKVRMAVEREQAMAERIASEKRLSAIFHASPIHQMITDYSTDRIIDINDRFLKDLRQTRSNVIGRTTQEIGLMPDPEQMAQLKQELESSGIVRNVPVTVRGSTGTVYTSLTSMTRVQVHGKDLVYTQSVDITPQKKAQQTINALLNAPRDVSMLLDTSGKILAVNHAASVRYKIPLQDLIGRDAFTLTATGYGPKRREWVDHVLRTRKPFSYTDDQTGRVYENNLYPVLDGEGKVSAVAVYSHDASEEVAAKLALRESEEKYRLVVENSHDTIYIYRYDHFLYINRQAEELTGYSRDELMQRDIWDFLHPDDRERLKKQALQRFAGGEISSAFEARILRKDGTVRNGQFFVDLVDFLGTQAILGIARDITEQKRAEDAIREREQQLRSLSDNLPNGLVYQIVVDADGKRWFAHISAGVEAIHEVTAEEVLRDPSFLYTQIVKADRAAFSEAEDRALVSLSPFSFEARVRTPSGKDRWLLYRSAPRPLPGGGVLWDGIELDVTATKRSEEELRSAYEQLAASQEELQGQFEALRDGQEQLLESEEKYRTLVEHTEDGVFVAQAGNIIFVNESLAGRAGYSSAELIGQPFAQLIAPEDREIVTSRHIQRLSGNSLPDNYEFSLLRKDGTTRLKVRIRVGTGRYHGSLAVIGTLHDVTEERQREAALAKSEELHRKTVAAVPDIIVRTDLEGTIIYINEKGAQIAGETDPAALTGRSVFSFFAPECLPLAIENTRLMFERPLGPVEYIFLNKDGARVSLEVNGDVLRTPEGTPYGMVYICRDIAERQQAEEALRQSEELYRSLVTASPDGIAMLDTKGFLTYVSPKALELFGLSRPDEAIGTNVLDWLDTEDRDLARQQFETVISKGHTHSRIFRMRRKDGSGFVVEMHSTVFHDHSGSITGMVSILHDITERRQAELALIESEENYRRIIENMQDVFYRVNREGIITMISTYGAHLVGFDSADEIIGKYRATDFYPDLQEREEFLSYLHRERVVTGYPLTLRDRHGKLHYATASSRLLYDADGNVNGIEGVLHDVTQIREVETALLQANRQIKLMTCITRHDIRNQLLALNGWLELSRASVDDPDRMLDLINREQKIASIIGQQIDFTTFFDDMGVRPPVWQDLETLIRNSAAALPFKDVQLAVDLPATEIFSDPLLEKVFYNLFDNALRYGGGSMTKIQISAHYDETGLTLAIEDDGAGIPARDKLRLFERGYGRNTGLGLFLVREILAITGLTISETGSIGTGARFEIHVPQGKFRVAGKNSQEIPAGPDMPA
jgi:PAS domain S-box-containing protein